MRVKIGPYKRWFGPYQLAEFLCFWAKKKDAEILESKYPEWVHEFGEFLAYGSVLPKPERKPGDIFSFNNDGKKSSWLYNFLVWLDSRKKRKISVKIDPWDCWDAQSTLAYIILPLLKQLREGKQGAPFVAYEDVPPCLCPTDKEMEELDKYDTDSHFFERWKYVLDEMIFAFEHVLNEEWEEEFSSGEHDIKWQMDEKGFYVMMKGENDTWTRDYDKIEEINKRISNGLILFGKYYQNLWC